MLKMLVKSSEKSVSMKWESGQEHYIRLLYFICDLKYVYFSKLLINRISRHIFLNP